MSVLNSVQSEQVVPQINAIAHGESYALGYELGETLRQRIHHCFDILSSLEFFRLQQPWWMPYTAFLWSAESRAQSLLQAHVERSFPQMFERINGMAAGSGVRVGTLYLYLALEAVMASIDSATRVDQIPEPFAACTALAARGERSAFGSPFVVHNFDNVAQSREFFVVREICRPQQYRSLEFTGAPLGGVIDGVNEAGLCIAYDYAMTVDGEQSGPPVSLAIDDALGACSTVAAAAQRIQSHPRCGGAILMLADASGDIASLELSSTRSFLRRPSSGEDVLHHSNAFQASTMKKVQVSPHACYAETTPFGLRGQRVLQSPERRDERLHGLLSQLGRLGAEEVGQLISDHGPDGQPSSDTVCMHGDHWSTIASLQLFPVERKMRIGYGPACQAEFRELSL
ncbi:C45 family autoproteolytic acyltransferase/hydolase [Lignipirellula cremea]|uniref:Acyl-coenzyme A:6-aminopenicillanic acid acyl-transferase n=1 Tax=Lignipirellula cremea TaxID=2528010 RepID=A0A518DT21_9BACT|nr:C45 family peptidase [Lignipirellula cremea]QDU94948.1 Acyl-coenzyme A:6-aminopenicillanic acid acyl-transferase [Lignipirellula cremea]